MKLHSLNVSLPREIAYQGRTIHTGIYKAPVEDRLWLGRLNLAGDGQADLKNHGGAHKAVYAYPLEHYDTWRKELGAEMFNFGQFGENLTLQGLTEDSVHIGDRYRIGGALLEVSQPRVPCFKLGVRMAREDFPKLFLNSGRVGFYLRVLEEGELGVGETIEIVSTDHNRMTVREIHQLLFFDKGNLEGARKALGIQALSPGWRGAFQEVLGLSAEAKGL